ncbi:MAG: hypothetical protein BRC34_06915 [Cyanobacteria bacterium QH_1_48_107]|nr:MAG: hypothetical protein BRC34_06915 [Cyanobacteria bacterium QH_1_48_107]PSO91944.1 MAG: hypothetical protein BRC46_09790 [Cyanobacteria bacterium QS_6_48_18]
MSVKFSRASFLTLSILSTTIALTLPLYSKAQVSSPEAPNDRTSEQTDPGMNPGTGTDTSEPGMNPGTGTGTSEPGMNPGTGSSTSPESSGNALSQYSAQEAPLLERGSEGEAVRDVQTFLKNAGMYTGNVDGSFGSNMESAVREFQKSQGLTTDGIVGPDTWEAMTGFSST